MSKKSSKLAKQQAGFTLVELSIATVVFSVILLVCVMGLLQVGKMFYKGVTSVRTQDTTRSIIEEISRPIQFSGKAPAPNDSATDIHYSAAASDVIHSVCIGDQRYSYATDVQVDGSVVGFSTDPSGSGNRRMPHALWRDTTNDPNCAPLDLQKDDPSNSPPVGATTTSANGQEMLGGGMRLSKLNVNQVGGSAGSWQIDVWVVFGDEDLLDRNILPGHTICKSGAGSQFCALSELSTVVTRRLE